MTGIVAHSDDFACTSPPGRPARFSDESGILASRGTGPPHLVAVQAPAPPLIDGRLQDPVWQLAPGTSAFTQSVPFDGGRPSEKTVLRVLYDESAIYIGFDCEQVRTPIVERLTRRDRDSESEWVYVQIDSRNDGKSAYMFAVNIAGVLADAQIIDQTTYSWEWDENWEAKTARTKRGWSAEIRIPLRVLRFDSKLPVQSWGLQASRFIAQRQETDLWTYVPRDVAAPIAFYGRLDGLRDLKGAGALELQPFVLASGQRRDASQIAIGSGTTGTASAGLDLKWHIAQDLTFDVALNPDFSQVELDQIILNLGTYETFLPEKRPFFLEGIDAFSFPMQVFYSRRIGSAPVAPSLRSDASSNEELVNVPTPATIYGAGKLVGRLSPNWTIGALSALTAANHVTIYDNVDDTKDRPAGGAGHRVQRPAPQARARQRRPHRHHRNRLDDLRGRRRLPAADRIQLPRALPLGRDPARRQQLLPRRLRRRPRRPLALAVGRLRRQRRVHRVVHPRRAHRSCSPTGR